MGQDFAIDKSFFKLRCTPIINLFPVTSEPIVTEEIKKSYKLYTNYLKSKFLFFHSMDKLKYIDDENKTQEIIHVLNYPFYLHKKEGLYFYDFTLNEKEPNCFEITLHSGDKKIFIPEKTLYADIFVTNGFLCEKLKENIELNLVDSYPVNKGIFLNTPSKYLPGINSSDFYWKVISYLYSEKITFSDLSEFVADLKSIISINLEILIEKERGNLILNSIEDVKAMNKLFKIKKNNIFSFFKGKEISLFINYENISSESIAIFSECIFSFLKNICPLNLCISLLVIDSNTKRILYTCSAEIGVKKAI